MGAGPKGGPGVGQILFENLLLLVVLPLFVGNAVRAAGWMVMFGKGFVNSVLGGLGLIASR